MLYGRCRPIRACTIRSTRRLAAGRRGMDDVDIPGSSAYIRNPLRGLSEGSRDGCHAVVSSGLVNVSSA